MKNENYTDKKIVKEERKNKKEERRNRKTKRNLKRIFLTGFSLLVIGCGTEINDKDFYYCECFESVDLSGKKYEYCNDCRYEFFYDADIVCPVSGKVNDENGNHLYTKDCELL